MTTSTLLPRPVSPLRRWWRDFYAAVGAVEPSGYELLTDRIDQLEERVRHLEAPQVPPQGG